MKAFTKKNYYGFHAHIKEDMHAKFQLSRVISIFIIFYQLLTAHDSWYEKNTGIFMYTQSDLYDLKLFVFIIYTY